MCDPAIIIGAAAGVASSINANNDRLAAEAKQAMEVARNPAASPPPFVTPGALPPSGLINFVPLFVIGWLILSVIFGIKDLLDCFF